MPLAIMVRRILTTMIWLIWVAFLVYGIIAVGLSPFAIIPLCWLIFILYWWITAFRAKATAETQNYGSAMAHRIPVIVAWMLLADWRLGYPMNMELIFRTRGVLLTGDFICVLGLLVTIWARRTLAGNWSSDVTFKKDHELIRTGPYRFARHPIYTGILIMMLGSAIEIGMLRGFIGLAVMFIGFWIKLKQEERLMLQHFPDQYPAYRREVKALIPFIL